MALSPLLLKIMSGVPALEWLHETLLQHGVKVEPLDDIALVSGQYISIFHETKRGRCVMTLNLSYRTVQGIRVTLLLAFDDRHTGVCLCFDPEKRGWYTDHERTLDRGANRIIDRIYTTDDGSLHPDRARDLVQAMAKRFLAEPAKVRQPRPKKKKKAK